MYVTAGVLHDTLYVVAPLAYDMRVLCVRDVHLYCDAIALQTRNYNNCSTVDDLYITIVSRLPGIHSQRGTMRVTSIDPWPSNLALGIKRSQTMAHKSDQ